MKPALLSEHFSLHEAVISQEAERNGINNTPDSNVINVMYKTAVKLEKVRALLGDSGIHVSSWFRNAELNHIVGGTANSQHIAGEAVDFICPTFGTCLDICKKIIENADLIGFDQLILEHSWVHISFAIGTGKPRGQVLSLLATGKYSVGLTNKNGESL